MSPELTSEMAIRIGGFDPRYARVLAIATSGSVGLTLIDPNGDGNHEEIEHVYLNEAAQWVAGGSSGGGTPSNYGPHGWGEYTPSNGHGVRYAYGRSRHPGRHSVALECPFGFPAPAEDDWWVDRTVEVTATDEGRWVWIERTAHDD